MRRHNTSCNKVQQNKEKKMNQLDFIIAKKNYLTIFSVCNEFPKCANYCRGIKKVMVQSVS